MDAGIAGAWPLVLAGLAMLALMLLGMHRRWRARLRQRVAVGEAGVQLAFDACAPEGGMVSYEDFPSGRLRTEYFSPVDPRRG